MRDLTFWQRVDASGDCWEWLGWRDRYGYGQFRSRRAHRVVWERLVGPIPAGLTIDHRCRNHGCVNPDHMEPVTRRENGLRGFSPPALNARKELCHLGHPLSSRNGRRHCPACVREATRRYQARKRAEVPV
jgi:hypothetical protein